MTKLFESIGNTTVEREVEETYNRAFRQFFPGIEISHPCMCDGYFEAMTEKRRQTNSTSNNIRLLMEYKYDTDMSSNYDRSKVIIQTIFYLKRFENEGRILPNIIFIGDKNECFILHVNDVLKYLSEDVDWTTAPSGAASAYPDFVLKISSDEAITPFVFDVDSDFDFTIIFDKIVNLTDNIVKKVRITEKNIDTIFGYFEKKIVNKGGKMPTKQLVSIFINCLLQPDEYCLHPKKKNVLITPTQSIAINSQEFTSFFQHFSDEYTPVEKMKFTEIADRLIEDTDRRKSGDFWTPTKFVDYAHTTINKVFGENWKDEYVVWDCCCGTKNLTRDYKFKELYCSTLFQNELDMATKYNPEATTFQFDFLNDDMDKIPDGLKLAIANKRKILFLMNPPYATACNHGSTSKESLCKTKVNALMERDDIGRCRENLLAQFLYRITVFKEKTGMDVNLAFFCNPIFLSGGTYDGFRERFLENFTYEDGFLFNAGYFSNTASSWGINFSCWKPNENNGGDPH